MALKGTVRRVQASRAEAAWARRVSAVRATVPELIVQLAAEPPGHGELLARCGKALRAHPHVNGAWRDGALELYGRINIGVELPQGTPTLMDADTRSADELAGELESLQGRELTPPEMAGATFTIAWAPADSFTTPPYPGQAALLAVGRSALTLCCDARVLRAPAASAFLQHLVS